MAFQPSLPLYNCLKVVRSSLYGRPASTLIAAAAMTRCFDATTTDADVTVTAAAGRRPWLVLVIGLQVIGLQVIGLQVLDTVNVQHVLGEPKHTTTGAQYYEQVLDTVNRCSRDRARSACVGRT